MVIGIDRALTWFVLDVRPIKKPPHNGKMVGWLVPDTGSLLEVIQEWLKNSNFPVIAWDLLYEVCSCVADEVVERMSRFRTQWALIPMAIGAVGSRSLIQSSKRRVVRRT